MALLGIDIGTTGCKVVAYTVDGNPISSAYREYQMITEGEWIGLDSDRVFLLVAECIGEVISATHGHTIEGVSVSSMTDTFTPIDINGRPMLFSVIPFDKRGIEEANELAGKYSAADIFQTTGMTISSSHTLCKILWLRKHYGKVVENTWKFLCYEDFVLWKLGAPPTTSFSTASKTMLFNINTEQWDDTMLAEAGIRRDQLPTPVGSGVQIGVVSEKAGTLTGLRPGTPLISGGFDQACCGLASGVVEEGDVLDTTGTNEILFFVPNRHRKETLLKYNMNYSQHVIKNMNASYALIFNAGGAFKWCRDTFFDITKRQERDIYTYITNHLRTMPAKAYFLPFLTGVGTPEMVPEMTASFGGLSFDTDKFELAQAILEGITYEMRYNLELIKDINEKNIDLLTAAGGAAKSPYWLQLKSDICGVEIKAPRSFEPGACGAAILAGVGAGIYKDWSEGVSTFSTAVICDYYTPNVDSSLRYEAGYRRYRILRENYIQLSKTTTERLDN